MVQCLKIVELFGPQHTIHELMLSLFIRGTREGKHELVDSMVGPISSTICEH